MVSELAKGDIELLESDGKRVPVEMIIRLNALGLKIQHHPDCELYTMPRFAVVEDQMIRQPSIRQ